MTEFEKLKADLIDAWSQRGRQPAAASLGGIQFQCLQDRQRSRAGLAVGQSIDPGTGQPRLEMRVTAQSGPNFNMAAKLANEARGRGVGVVLKYMRPPRISPNVAVAQAAGTVPLPAAVECKRPLFIGQSVAHERGTAGSLGGFVRIADGKTGILSCTHVLAPQSSPRARDAKRTRAGDRVHQPGPSDQGVYVSRFDVGQLTNFAQFVPEQRNNLDAAVAEVDKQEFCIPDGNRLPDIPEVDATFRGKPFGPMITLSGAHIGARVVKFGRSTGFTRGAVISAINFENLAVDYGKDQQFTFSSVIEIQWNDGDPPFTLPGDSGSMVLLEDGLHPVGLHFAALEADRTNFVIPLDRICATLRVKLI